jgi:BirA family biotin operon repressor/biotin-[acetyl-CoA-carboxylase] ligase
VPDRSGLTIGLAERLGVRVVEHGPIESTMQAALADPGPAPVLHLAKSQSEGRGRFGREWRSPPGNLYATIRWPEPEDPFPGGLLGAVQVEWARAIPEAGGPPVRCKWPNDGWLDGGKWSGLLATRPAERPGEIHLGLGANLVAAPVIEGVSVACLRPRWREWPGVSEVAALLLGAALRVLREGPAGVGPRLADWSRHDALTTDERVVVEGPGGPIEGAYRGIDAEGRLRLATLAGEIHVSSGDVRRVRPA